MAYKSVDDSSLTAVANKIREKGNTSAQLSFPDGFVSAIGNIINPLTSNLYKVVYGSINNSGNSSSNRSVSITVDFIPTAAILVVGSGTSGCVQSVSTSLDNTDNYGLGGSSSYPKITSGGLIINGNTVSMTNPVAGTTNLDFRYNFGYVIWGK